jgi:hypothetical protein
MRRPLDDSERAFVAANRDVHLKRNLPGPGDLTFRLAWVAAVVGLAVALFGPTLLAAFACVLGTLAMIWAWRRDRQVVFDRPTYWDPKHGGAWEVEENVLEVTGAMTVAGPPEDYETWLVLRLDGPDVYVSRLTDVALPDLSLPSHVEQVAWSCLRLRKLEPRGPGLPTRLDGDPVPSVALEWDAGTWVGPRGGGPSRMKRARLPRWIRDALPGA